MPEYKMESLIPGNVVLTIHPRVEAVIEIKISHIYNDRAMARAVKAMLLAMGLDLRDGNFNDTPARVARMWGEWLQPRSFKLPVFPTPSEGMVTLVGHKTTTVCPHHLLPVELTVDLAYIPQGTTVGISKLARLVDFVCTSFTLQENIGEFATSLLQALLLPKGAYCRVRGKHGCMRLRGIRSTGEIVTTSEKGIFLSDEKSRVDFHNATIHKGD